MDYGHVIEVVTNAPVPAVTVMRQQAPEVSVSITPLRPEGADTYISPLATVKAEAGEEVPMPTLAPLPNTKLLLALTIALAPIAVAFDNPPLPAFA